MSVQDLDGCRWADMKDIEEFVLNNKNYPRIDESIEKMKEKSSYDGYTDQMDGSEAHAKGVRRVLKLAELIKQN